MIVRSESALFIYRGKSIRFCAAHGVSHALELLERVVHMANEV